MKAEVFRQLLFERLDRLGPEDVDFCHNALLMMATYLTDELIRRSYNTTVKTPEKLSGDTNV